MKIFLPLMCVGVAFGAGCGDDDEPAARRASSLQATWQASPTRPLEATPLVIADQTVRMVARISRGGSAVRARLSNLYGTTPLTLDAVHIGVSSGGAALDVATDRALLFDGAASVTIPAGTERWSDEVELAVADRAALAVSVYVRNSTALTTGHAFGQRTTYFAAGDQVSAASLTPLSQTTSYYWLIGLDVRNTSAAHTIVAFGDSITDGYASTVDADRRWPDILSERILGDSAFADYSVVNAGIGANRVVSGSTSLGGDRGTERFARDVLAMSGVSHVTILLGINDLGLPYGFNHQANPLGAAPCGDPPTPGCNDDANSQTVDGQPATTAEQVTAGLQTMVDAAHDAGLRVFLGTLLPYGEAAYYTDVGETQRAAINAWVRANTSVDGVLDFDALIRSPQEPRVMRADYDSGDRLHPGDAGYDVMARSVDLATFID